MTEPPRNSAWWLVFIAVVLLAVFFSEAYGQHECQGNCPDGGGVSVSTASEAVITANGSRSYGLSGSDMDIGQCIYHAGGLTVAIGFRNKFCEGMEMIRVGLVDAGVLHICKQTKIGRNYDSLKDCKDGLVINYSEITRNDTEKTGNDSPVTESDDEDDNRYDALYARMATYEGEIAQAKEDTRKARIEAQRANTEAQRAPKIQIVQQPFLTDEKRAKLQAILDER